MQYKMIEPYLKRKTTTNIGDKQFFQSVEDRKKLVCIRQDRPFRDRPFDRFRMACMNVFFALVVQHHAQVTGGMLINTSDPLS